MRLVIESTTSFVMVNSQPARVWIGTTQGNNEVLVLVPG